MSNSRSIAGLISVCAVLGSALATAPSVRADSPAAAAAIAKYDKDNDKTLDLAEVKSAAAMRFATLDKDGDGTLDSKELRGLVGPMAFKSADTDHDGTLSQDEYMALVQKVFEQADTDHDGTLDATELSSKSGQRLLRLIG